jgi:hypothetical protein
MYELRSPSRFKKAAIPSFIVAVIKQIFGTPRVAPLFESRSVFG